jgi:hypothetical protein
MSADSLGQTRLGDVPPGRYGEGERESADHYFRHGVDGYLGRYPCIGDVCVCVCVCLSLSLFPDCNPPGLS